LTTLTRYLARLLIAVLIALPFLWANGVLSWRVTWSTGAILAALLASVPPPWWERLPLRSMGGAVWRVGAFALLVMIPIVIEQTTAARYPAMAWWYALTGIVLYGLSLLWAGKNSAGRLGGLTFGIVLSLILIEVGAGALLGRIEGRTRATPPPPNTPVVNANTATPAATFPIASPATPSPTAVAAESTPTAPQPIPGLGYVDYLRDGGEAAWGVYTGYAPRINSQARAYMYDSTGALVYDTLVTFNGKGMRGAEVAYEKPAEVYRILIIGDSFVEGVQVDYPQTFSAVLDSLLRDHTPNLAGKTRFEVIALGRMGWGTLQEYLYYIVEGYKFNADLVILSFYINDVADNRPAYFYPNINNTNYEYLFEGDSVRIVDTNLQALPPNDARVLYNALPAPLQGLNLTRLLLRTFDPPPEVRPDESVLQRVHPQWYIYVSEPEITGYAEAWRRTAWGLQHLDRAVRANGGQFAVAPIFIGQEMVLNVSQWYPDLVKGWQWDIDLPDRKLAEALAGTGALIFPTRPTFEGYAAAEGGQVFDLLYIAADRHFNATGHRLMAEALYAGLRGMGILP